jgi:twinkle protein
MAEFLNPDTIDFSAYMRKTEASAKIHPASSFHDEMLAEFAVRTEGVRSVMLSTKLRDVIEFRPGEVTAWTGYSGHRKSMFTSQVALDLCRQEERCLLVSLEMSPSKTLNRMARQAAGEARPAEAWLSRFSRWTDSRLWLFDHLGRISPDFCLAVATYFAAELGGRHVFIDSMMMVCASEESMDEQKQFVTDLCRLAQETRLHVHLVTHCRKPQSGDEKPPTKYDVRGSAAITDQVANVITVWQNKPKRAALEKDPNNIASLKEPDALITIDKQRNGSYEGRNQLWFDDRALRFCDGRLTMCGPYDLADLHQF